MVQWHEIHSHHCATIMTTRVHNSFHSIKWKLNTHQTITPFLPFHKPLAIIFTYSVSMILTFLNTLYSVCLFVIGLFHLL